MARIGRLAVNQHYQSKRLGGAVLISAAMYAARSEIAVFALIADAKDETAAAFYRHSGFNAFASDTLQLPAPPETFAKLLFIRNVEENREFPKSRDLTSYVNDVQYN